MAYNVAGLNARGPAEVAPASDSSRLGRQTVGENNPRLTPFELTAANTPVNYVALVPKVPATIFPRPATLVIGRELTTAGSN